MFCISVGFVVSRHQSSLCIFTLQKAEKRYGKLGDSQIDVIGPSSRLEENSGSSDEETRDEESNEERDLGSSAKMTNVSAPQDDLLVLKKRHIDFDPGPPLKEVGLTIL